jgi:hypothetical protein
MSPTKRPSAVAGLKRGLSGAQAEAVAPAPANKVADLPQSSARTKPIRVTLDLDPATYKELNRWLGTAAVAVNPDHPRLSLAKALRAMIHATTTDEVVTGVVLGLLRKEQEPI